jgi:arabinan endo-1,5-alpha-L-arabinosidase
MTAPAPVVRLTRSPRRGLLAAMGVIALVTAMVASTGAAQAAPASSPGTTATATPTGPRIADPGAQDPIAHDPTMVKQGGWYYVIITGDSGQPHTYLPMKRSRDLKHWTELGPVFTELPAWIPAALGVTPADAWAPDLSYANGRWQLYYAASQFGTQNSVIGLATTPTLDPGSPAYGWVDQGLVVRSSTGDSYNAIDPDYSTDGAGHAYLSFGSFWGGLKMRALDPATGLLSATDTTLYPLASRIDPDAEEGPSIVRHGGYFYLFLAFDFCCRGVNSDYRVMVGRSKMITGPYVDRAGVPLTAGGGSEVLRGYNEFVGTGGADVYVDGGRDWFVNHYYDATSAGTPRLNVRPLTWRSGWPVVGEPLDPSRTVGHGDAYVQLVSRSNPGQVVEDADCGYEGSNIRLWTNLGNTCQQWQWVYRGDGASDLLNRFSNKVAEVAACDNVDGGNVAQWGWLGYLPNNDCQRWSAVPTGQGWVQVQSVLTGHRVMDVAGCGTAPGTNIDVLTATPTACQQFRFHPVGRVLLAHASGVSGSPVLGCHSSQTRLVPGRPTPLCDTWTFRSAGAASYTVVNALTGRLLTARVGASGPRAGNASARSKWTVVPANDGTWTLGNAATGISLSVRLMLP